MALRFGVAGTGYWAETVHLSALSAHPDATLVGVWGRSDEKVDALAKKFGIASFRRFDDMLEHVDAVSIALPPQIQAPLALTAANAGKHLFLEKPLAMTPEEARAIVSAVERHRLTAMVFFLRRFVPEIESAIELARRERWNAADVRVHSSALVGDGPYARSLWRRADAGALWDIGPHVLSVLMPVLGAVQAIGAAAAVGKYVRFETHHAGGATGTVSLTLHADPGETANQYVFRGVGRELALPDPDFSRPAAFVRAVTEFTAAVRSGNGVHRADTRMGAEIVNVLAAVSRSMETRAVVRISRPGT